MLLDLTWEEDIVQLWKLGMLTPLFDEGEWNHGGEKNNVFRALWSKDIVYEYDEGINVDQIAKRS